MSRDAEEEKPATRRMIKSMAVFKLKKCPTCIGIGACTEGDKCPTCVSFEAEADFNLLFQERNA